MSDDDEHEFSLVMPFVVTASHGGPFDDAAYVAGWEMGKLSVCLADRRTALVATIRRDNLPQADLIAMDAGWTMTEEPPPAEMTTLEADAYAEWVHVTFERPS